MPDSITAGFSGGFKNSQANWRRRLIAFHNTATAGGELNQLVRQTHLWGVTNNSAIVRTPAGADGTGTISGSATPGSYTSVDGTFTGWRAFTEKWAKGAVLSNFDGIMVHNPFGTCQSVSLSALYDNNGVSNGGRRNYTPTNATYGQFRDFTTTTVRGDGNTTDAFGFSEQQMQIDSFFRVKEQNPELSWVADINEFEAAWTNFFTWRKAKAAQFPNDERYTKHFEVIAYVGTLPEYYTGMIGASPGVPSYATTPLYGEEWEWQRWLKTDYTWSTLFSDPIYSTNHNSKYWRNVGLIREIRQCLQPYLRAGFTAIGFDAGGQVQEDDPRVKVMRWLQTEKGIWTGVESSPRNTSRNLWHDNAINLTEQTTREDNEFWDSANNNAYYSDPTQYPVPGDVTGMFSRTETQYNGPHHHIPWKESKYTKISKQLHETPNSVSDGIRYQFTVTHSSTGTSPIKVGDVVRLEQNTGTWVSSGYGHIEAVTLLSSTTSQITANGFFGTITNFLVNTWRIVNLSTEPASTTYFGSTQLYPITVLSSTQAVSWKDVPGLWGEMMVMLNTAYVWNVHIKSWFITISPGWVPGCLGWNNANSGNLWESGTLPPIDFTMSENIYGTGWGQMYIKNEVVAKYRSVLLPPTYYINNNLNVRTIMGLTNYPAFQVPETNRTVPNSVRRTDLSYTKPS